jgi:hypothetical protein
MWYTPRGIQVMSVPDLSAFLPPAVVEAVTGFVEALDEPGRARLSRALNAVIEDVAVEWREQVSDLGREAEFEHALPARPVDVPPSRALRDVDDVVDLLERVDLRWRADVASALLLHYLKDFSGDLTWSVDEPQDSPTPSDEQGSRPRDLVSASVWVLRKNSPVIGVFRDDSDGEWLFFAERDDWSRGITSAPTSWDEMLARDESLAELRDLPPGHGAWRPAPGQPWQTVGSLAELSRLIRDAGGAHLAHGPAPAE